MYNENVLMQITEQSYQVICMKCSKFDASRKSDCEILLDFFVIAEED